MKWNGYFGVRSLETVVNGIRALPKEAQIALFVGVGIAAYGYFKHKYGKEKNNGNSKEA